MKNQSRIFNALFLGTVLFFSSVSKAGTADSARLTSNKQTIAIADFDTRDYLMNQSEVLQFLINELNRIGYYEVLDKYDMEYLVAQQKLTPSGCFSKICLTEIGKKLGVKKMLTGNISKIEENITITLRILDVQHGVFEKTANREFLLIKGSELTMIRITMNDLFGMPNDENVIKKLTQKAEFDNTINNPYRLKLRADGPRMGITMLTGLQAEIMRGPSNTGGFNGVPHMFQFGYQFEKQYLNEGNFQALFEFIPMITGMDQGLFIPSLAFLNGLRSNRNGFEFAFGPVLSVNKMARGYYDSTNRWVLKSSLPPGALPSDHNYEWRPDSRGEYLVTTGFVFAVGKTFKSGKMNLPVNMFVVPGRNGMRFGLSMGWNGKERYELRN